MPSNKAMLRKDMGKRVRTLRRVFGITIDELSEQVGITPSYLGLIERGARGITVERLIDFSAFFKCTADFLLTGREESVSDVRFGNSPLANSIDLLLNENEKQKLHEFIKAIR
ncbi:MAG: helix-turn-helix domain-containing protein [Defluviitaleaceae bacterium]|nr:helix-turn-helix domain-containing protein [Defluviitaleaceae bacterium]